MIIALIVYEYSRNRFGIKQPKSMKVHDPDGQLEEFQP